MTSAQADTIALTIVKVTATLGAGETLTDLTARPASVRDMMTAGSMLYRPQRSELLERAEPDAVAFWTTVTERAGLTVMDHSCLAIINPDGEILASVEVQ